jgi:hypothetical protein
VEKQFLEKLAIEKPIVGKTINERGIIVLVTINVLKEAG